MKYIFAFTLLLVISCNPKIAEQTVEVTPDIRIPILADHAMVVSARAEASKIGLEIIRSGGNAFDAMVATEMALAVCFPYAGNLGGGGFMVYRMADGSTGTLDYREKAPLNAHKDMYLDEDGNVIPDLSYTGALAVGVPGTVKGIFSVHERFGSLPISKIMAPVIKLAEEGYIVTEAQEARFKHYHNQFVKVNGHEILYNNKIKAGERIKNIALANTLQRIAKYGSSEFYQDGETARMLVRFMKEKDGIITKEDLEQYYTVWRDPIKFKYDDLNIISMSPPSSGGITLGQIMNMIEPYELSRFGHNTVKSMQVITEAERRAYADRNYYLGDPDFVDIPEDMLDADYLKKRMCDFNQKQAGNSQSVQRGKLVNHAESDETTHYSIVDNQGNAIAVTTTINGAYGSKLFIDSLGFFLNNEMDDFSAKPGVPNAYGLVGAEANAIAPGKRMLSSMTPTIVEKDDELYMVLGSPGGSTIITSVLQTILNVHEYDMNMQEAVDAPRFHHQWLPDEIMIEPGVFAPEVKAGLIDLGYKINEKESRVIGKVDAILRLPNGKLQGGADRRGDDAAVGY